MKEELIINLVNLVLPYIDKENLPEIKNGIQMELTKYEVTEKHTELSVVTQGKNEIILAKFIAAKLASGRTMRTLEYYKNSLIAFFSKVNKDYDDVTADDIRIYLAVRANRDKVSKVTVDNERRVVSSFYDWLQKEEIILKNPMSKIDVIKITKPKKRAFSDMELELIRDNCNSAREKAIIELLISTWCRVTELAGVQLMDIDGDEILVHGKGEKDRIVYMTAKAKVAVQNYLAERTDTNPYLFPKMKNAGDIRMLQKKGMRKANYCKWYQNKEFVDDFDRIGTSTIESIVREIGKRAGVTNTHPHRFRRTGATFALRSGMSLMTVSKLLGHSNIGTTQIYLDITDYELKDAHEKFVR